MIKLQTLKINQTIVIDGTTRTLFSYDTPIVSITTAGIVLHDAWDYSVTTGKYRNQFLGNGIADVRKHLASGKYILKDYYA